MNRKVLLLFILVVFIHLMFNQNLQLHYDEAYYWVWSKNLQLSYYDHPPMIAYLIHLTTLASDKEFFIRLTGVLCASFTVIMMYLTAKRLFNQKTADITVILALAWPLLEGNFFITTIDAPLLLFWSVAVYFLARGLVNQERCHLYLAGISIGLDLLSKYTAVLILPGIFIYLILSSTNRKLLISPQIYFALILAVVVFSPVIIWNYHHQWVSFLFQFHHGVPNDKELNLAGLGDYLGSFIGAANPFISLPLVAFIFIKRKLISKDERYLFLLSIFIFVAVFFAYNSLYKFMEANWVAPTFISGIIFLAACLAEYNITWIYKVAITLVLILFPLIKMPEIFVPRGYRSKIPAINAFMGNQQLYQQIKNNYLQSNDIIMACDYGNASRGWYYLNSGRVYVLDDFKFTNTYQYWNSQLKFPIENALYFCDNDDKTYQDELKKYFRSAQPLGIVSYHDSFVNNKLYVYHLSN